MIDYHCHLLPALDDGPRTLKQALAMARSLWEAGFEVVHCTPHCIRGCYDNTPEGVREATAALQEAVRREGIGLELRPGMEYYLDELFLREKELLPLGDSRLVLVEAPSQAVPEVVQQGLLRVIEEGNTPLIAHPERSEIFNAPDFEARVLDFNSKLKTQNLKLSPEAWLFQANIGSFLCLYGAAVQRRAYDLLRLGRYDRLGSDGHGPRRLAAMLEAWQTKLERNPALRQLAGLQGDGGEGEGFSRVALAGGR